jgi:predicted nucleotide-binding protein (sugar kinase/HSP70/actin superfamily)
MTKFEFLKQGEEYIRKNSLNRLVQKIKPLIEAEGKINPLVERRLNKFLEDKDIKDLNIDFSEVIKETLELIKSENGGVLPENLEDLNILNYG